MGYNENILHVGLMGPAGSGKTTTANLLAPSGVLPLNQGFETLPRHYILASPIYDIVGIKRNTVGFDAQSRIMHQLHNLLFDIIGHSTDYETLVETVYDIYESDAGTLDDSKPRTFMQWVGDICRSFDEDCFPDLLLRRIRSEYLNTQKELIESGADEDFVLLSYISDVRRKNEVARIRAQSKSLLIRFEAPIEVLNERIYNRDGKIMTPEQWSHATEQEANQMDKSEFDLVLDTSEMTRKEQALAVAEFIQKETGLAIHTPIQSVSSRTLSA